MQGKDKKGKDLSDTLNAMFVKDDENSIPTDVQPSCAELVSNAIEESIEDLRELAKVSPDLNELESFKSSNIRDDLDYDQLQVKKQDLQSGFPLVVLAEVSIKKRPYERGSVADQHFELNDNYIEEREEHKKPSVESCVKNSDGLSLLIRPNETRGDGLSATSDVSQDPKHERIRLTFSITPEAAGIEKTVKTQPENVNTSLIQPEINLEELHVPVEQEAGEQPDCSISRLAESEFLHQQTQVGQVGRLVDIDGPFGIEIGRHSEIIDSSKKAQDIINSHNSEAKEEIHESEISKENLNLTEGEKEVTDFPQYNIVFRTTEREEQNALARRIDKDSRQEKEHKKSFIKGKLLFNVDMLLICVCRYVLIWK